MHGLSATVARATPQAGLWAPVWAPVCMLVCALLCTLAAPAAHATLGEGAASIHVNQMRLAGTRRQAAALGVLSAQGVQVHTLTQADGSTVRQYVSADGRVYAVAWNTRYKPRLSELLGTHFSAYAQAGRRAMQQRPGVLHQARLQQGDLVVESAAHLNAFVGRAYLRSRLPAATSPDAIR